MLRGIDLAEKLNPVLSPSEWEIMKILWQSGPMAARDVIAALPKDCDWANKTVKTLLSRLVAKEAVDYDQVGNSYLYRPAVRRSDVTRQEVRSVIQRMMSGASSPIIAHFIDEATLSEAEIKDLKKLLDEKRKRLPKKRGSS